MDIIDCIINESKFQNPSFRNHLVVAFWNISALMRFQDVSSFFNLAPIMKEVMVI